MVKANATYPSRRTGFSLIEVMIALTILAFGLLFIAAALPAGVSYVRDTVNEANALATSEYAFDQIKSHIVLERELPLPVDNPDRWRREGVVRPRRTDNLLPQTYPPVKAFEEGRVVFEPQYKWRPLIGVNVDLSDDDFVGDRGEDLLRELSPTPEALFPEPFDVLRYDLPDDSSPVALVNSPALPLTSRVFPPLPFDADGASRSFGPYTPAQFFNGGGNRLDRFRYQQGDSLSAGDRRFVWSALYRRVTYADDDPRRYEFLIFVMRRASARHRFARQDFGPNNFFESPQADPDVDLLIPEPWLVAFREVPALSGNDEVDEFVANVQGIPTVVERVVDPDFAEPATLSWEADDTMDEIIVPGSYIVPAVFSSEANDAVGFTPHSENLTPPIYRVLDVATDGTTTRITTENPGTYPFLRAGFQADQFRCWVFPPAFEQRDRAGRPIFDRESPVLRVERRVLTLDEF